MISLSTSEVDAVCIRIPTHFFRRYQIAEHEVMCFRGTERHPNTRGMIEQDTRELLASSQYQ
jgi:hypothetical protein